MKLKEMIPNIRYKVTTGGSTLNKGETVYIQESKGNLYCPEVAGWLDYSEWKLLRNQVEINLEYYENQILKKKKELEECEKTLEFVTELSNNETKR